MCGKEFKLIEHPQHDFFLVGVAPIAFGVHHSMRSMHMKCTFE